MTAANPHGRITSGIPADGAALKTLDFIERHLAAWRDDPERPRVERERDLNSQLCKFLNVAAIKSDFAMVHFHHEEPEGVSHSADFSANPVEKEWIEGRQYTKYEPILVIEGKRLPTPGSGREREYLTSGGDDKPAGGVQRFKLGLHGARLAIAGMVGYVQAKACADWFAEINCWIDEFVSSGDKLWKAEERLDGLVCDATARASRCRSEHPRKSSASPTIRLTHLWVEM